MSETVVRAAGGVVIRDGPDGPMLVVIHRPKYDDWTLPKGKLVPGESDQEAALREVGEETGIRGELREELPAVSYRDALGRPKIVRYWLMTPTTEPAFVPTAEVDEVRWLGLGEAERLLTYAHDRGIVRSLAERT